jgi:hypothetical protein
MAVEAPHDGFIIFPNHAAKPGEGLCYVGRASTRSLAGPASGAPAPERTG